MCKTRREHGFCTGSEVGGFFCRIIFAGLLFCLILLLFWRKISAWSPQLCRRALKGHHEGHSIRRSGQESPSQELSPFCWLLSSPSRHRGVAGAGFPLFFLGLRGFLWGKKKSRFFYYLFAWKATCFLFFNLEIRGKAAWQSGHGRRILHPLTSS